MVSNPNEDFYDDLKALSSEPVGEDLEQLRVSSVELFEHVEGTRIGTRSLDIKSKKTVQRLEPQAPKKDGIGIEKGRYPGPGCLVIDRAAKTEGYKKRRSWLSGTYLRPTLDVPGSDVDRTVFLRDLLAFLLAWRRALHI